ncbi:hypothetical protein LLE87_36460, partial [Paenibacillus polymyxa]|nr:hypothetical protein [Paenibacillus polymyxa]
TDPDALCELRESLHSELAALQAAGDIDALRDQAATAQAQYDAAAARGHLGQRTRRGAGVAGHQEFDLFVAGRGRRGQGERRC